jgi:hypothetical protein
MQAKFLWSSAAERERAVGMIPGDVDRVMTTIGASDPAPTVPSASVEGNGQ